LLAIVCASDVQFGYVIHNSKADSDFVLDKSTKDWIFVILNISCDRRQKSYYFCDLDMVFPPVVFLILNLTI